MQNSKFTLISQKEIIIGARRKITKYGSEHLTLTKLAEEIDIPQAVIHPYFSDRKAILSFMIDDIKSSLLADPDKIDHKN